MPLQTFCAASCKDVGVYEYKTLSTTLEIHRMYLCSIWCYRNLTCPVAMYIAVTIFAGWALLPPILPAMADPTEH